MRELEARNQELEIRDTIHNVSVLFPISHFLVSNSCVQAAHKLPKFVWVKTRLMHTAIRQAINGLYNQLVMHRITLNCALFLYALYTAITYVFSSVSALLVHIIHSPYIHVGNLNKGEI